MRIEGGRVGKNGEPNAKGRKEVDWEEPCKAKRELDPEIANSRCGAGRRLGGLLEEEARPKNGGTLMEQERPWKGKGRRKTDQGEDNRLKRQRRIKGRNSCKNKGDRKVEGAERHPGNKDQFGERRAALDDHRRRLSHEKWDMQGRGELGGNRTSVTKGTQLD